MWRKKKPEDWLSVKNWPEDKTEAELIALGNKAELLLKDETYREVMLSLHQVLHSQIDSLAKEDVESLVSLSNQLRAIRSITGRLTAWARKAQ
jgi:hypothetical protein